MIYFSWIIIERYINFYPRPFEWIPVLFLYTSRILGSLPGVATRNRLYWLHGLACLAIPWVCRSAFFKLCIFLLVSSLVRNGVTSSGMALNSAESATGSACAVDSKSLQLQYPLSQQRRKRRVLFTQAQVFFTRATK